MDPSWQDIVLLHPMETGRGPLGIARNHLMMKLEQQGLGIIMVKINHIWLCGCPCLGTLVGKMEIDITRALMSDWMDRKSGHESLPLSFPASMEQGTGMHSNFISSIVQEGMAL